MQHMLLLLYLRRIHAMSVCVLDLIILKFVSWWIGPNEWMKDTDVKLFFYLFL